MAAVSTESQPLRDMLSFSAAVSAFASLYSANAGTPWSDEPTSLPRRRRPSSAAPAFPSRPARKLLQLLLQPDLALLQLAAAEGLLLALST